MFSDLFEVMALFSHWKESQMVTWIGSDKQKKTAGNAAEMEKRLEAGDRPEVPERFPESMAAWIGKLLKKREMWKNTWRMPWVSVPLDCAMHVLTYHFLLPQSSINPSTLNAALMKEVDAVTQHMNLVSCSCLPVVSLPSC